MSAEHVPPRDDVIDGVVVYPFHARIPGMPNLFHVQCDTHGPIPGCDVYMGADQLRHDHIEKRHTAKEAP